MALFTLLFLKSTLIASRRMHCRVQAKVNVPMVMQQTRTSSSRDEKKVVALGMYSEGKVKRIC